MAKNVDDQSLMINHWPKSARVKENLT